MQTTPQIDLFSTPVYKRLLEAGFEELNPDNFEDFIKRPDLSMMLFVENPNRMKETMDAVVIAPELTKACQLIVNKAVVPPPHARKLAAIYGFRRWPALVFVKDGAYLGAVDGLRLWSELVAEVDKIINSKPSFPPSIGIPIKSC
ncbi:MAG: hydrogenase [Burkholderiales bacterium]|nr:hydrogenase [Burkholderiales bacterium]